MCGIAGLVSFQAPVDPAELMDLVRGIAHRGPDDQGIHVSPGQRCGLGHARLSIIDLSPLGHQPMLDAEVGNTIVFNGEIYNFAALRARCEAAGHRFRSHTDTEVILALYRLHGVECLAYLRGMFAFAIWDEARQRLFFARDRVGKKPFHYSLGRQGFAFCSEIDPLSRHPWVDRELDYQALDYYLQLQAVPAPLTIYRGIRKLLPAHYGLLEGGHLTVRRYWQPQYRDKLAITDADALDAFEEKFAESVRLRMVADVPVGALLSGGVDSSLTVALMARYADQPVRTFSVGFSEDAVDESAYAQQAADLCGSLHRPVRMSGPDLEDLPRLVKRYGEPYGDYSALPSFLVCSTARQEVAVVLNGDGGDELLGGYPRYELSERVQDYSRWVQHSLPVSLKKQVDWMLKSGRFPYRKLHRLFLGYAMADAAPLTMLHGVGSDRERRALLSFDGGGSNLPDWRLGWLGEARAMTDNPIDSMLWLDNHTYLPDDLLVKMDIAAMQCGLEARSPFLDHELIEFCARLPIDQKVRGGIGKYLIKKLAGRYFPDGFVHRRKMGFGIPLKAWLHGPMFPMVQDVLLDPASMAPLDHDLVRGYFQEFVKGAYAAEPMRIWTLLMYGLWRRHCYLS
jgi:asparagine synthase (glutamine-hydrolysing)